MQAFLKNIHKIKTMKEFEIRDWIFIAAILGGLSVALGAFGSHLLKDLLDTKDYDIFRDRKSVV